MNVATALLRFATLLGSDTAFCLTGGMAMHLNRALYESQSLRTVFVHHETAAVAAAEGYSKSWELSRPGLAVITSGPAVTNCLTGLASAFGDSTPLLVIAGQVKSSDINRINVRTHGIQEVDQLGLVSHVTKYAARVTAENIRVVLAEAYNSLTSGRLGPVFLEVPLDEQSRECDLGSFRPTGEVSTKGLTEPLRHLEAFRRPVVLIGNGVRRESSKVRSLIPVLSERRIPRLYTWLSFDLEPAANEGNQGCPGMFAPIHANRVLCSADLVVSIGARLDLATTAYSPGSFGSQAKRIIVDIDELELAKLQSDDGTTLIAADGGSFLQALIDGNLEGSEEWYQFCSETKQSALTEEQERLDSDQLTVREVSRIASRHSKRRVIVPASSGLAEETLTRFFEPEHQTLFFNGASLGSMGMGLAHGIGAAAGDPRDGVWIFEGDGGLLMNVQELSTLSFNFPTGVALFLLNNQGYASISASQGRTFGYEFGASRETGVAFPDWKLLVTSFGLPYQRIQSKSSFETVLQDWQPSSRTCFYDLYVPGQEPRGPQLTTAVVNGIPQTEAIGDLSW